MTKDRRSFLYNVVFECSFTERVTFDGDVYEAGDIDFFSSILTADNFLMAYERAKDFAVDYYSAADVGSFPSH